MEKLGVLVVSQDRVLPAFVRRALEPRGHRVEACGTVEECAAVLGSLGEARPVAVLPRRLGAIAGRELLARARRLLPSVPLVLASPEARDRELAHDEGAGFLPIPFTQDELSQTLGAATRRRRLILLADDSPLIHRHTTPILVEAGYDVVAAHDGEEALAAHAEHHPDLVVTDVEMPRLDGYGVCKALKQRDPHLPVVICSSLGESHDLERGFDAGADDYLVKPAAPDELVSRIRALFASIEPGGRERILVVDDSPAIRHLVADALVRQGFSVETAEDGAAALQAIEREPPELVITDYDMPRMTGFELVHALKRSPSWRDLPVMMLTARDTRRDQAQMRAVGLTSYLVKPFSVDKCVAMVERILAERRLLAYKEASRLYISDGAARAAEEAAAERERDPGCELAARAEEREVAVLFSDLCGFTTLSSRMQPREVVDLLNSFFDVMCPIVRDEAGDIDKFIGDAIMAIFDDAGPDADCAALRAVRAGLRMQRALTEWNRGNHVPLAMRIGINTGTVVRGDIGSRHVRLDYTVVGDVVNRAQRFESQAPRGGVLIGALTWQHIRDRVLVEERPGLHLKGVDEPVTGYVVLEVLEAPIADGAPPAKLPERRP